MALRIASGIIFYTFVVQILTEPCSTPNNETAECIPLYSCPILIGALASQQEVSIEFLRRSSCGGTADNPLVCCGTLANFTSENNLNQTKTVSKVSLLPDTRYCGLQHADDYYRTSNDTTIRITEFPWLARIKSRSLDPNVIEYKLYCSGSLINRRYILTAAHCVTDRTSVPVAVQLGEYNVKNTTDCVQEQQFEEECSEPVHEVGIEKVVLHPSYDARKKIHDIALIRLSKTVAYSDYIRPICLPFPGRTTAKIGDTLVSSGWGSRNLGEAAVEIKKKIFNKVIEHDECKKIIESSRIKLIENQLCSIALNNNTNFECTGDSGGPVTFSHKSQWHQEGIISYGKGCGPATTSVHTYVIKYLDWILGVIEP